MNYIKTNIEGLLILEPKVFGDDRGYFFESFNQDVFNENVGENIVFKQDNESKSSKNVLRGLHFQKPPYAQGKLVRVIKGSVLDVALDLRKGSKTYGQFEKIMLSESNKKQLWVPAGFAHGFLTLEDHTIFSYKCTETYHPDSEGGIQWNDPDLGIDWGVTNPILSEKDKKTDFFRTFVSPF